MAKAKKNEMESDISELLHRLKSNPPLFIGTLFVLILVIVSFVLVPALPEENFGTNGGALTFGYYNKVPINYSEGNFFDRTLRAVTQTENFSLESDYSKDAQTSETAMRVWQRAFYAALIHQAILDELKNAGYKAPAVEVDKEVANLPMFQENGRFSITKYRNYDKSNLLSLWRAVEEEYTENQYRNVMNGLLVSEAEKAFIGNMGSPERTFRLAVFSRSSYPDSEVAAYAAANPEHFRMVHLSKITLDSTEKEARQILDSVQSGKTGFEDTARNRSKDSYKDQGGDMGVRMAHELYNSIADEAQRKAVLTLKPGEFSEIVKDPAGWAFYRAEEAPYDADFSLQENIDKARSYMTQHAGGVMENWLAARAEEFISRAKGRDFEAAAKEAGAELKELGPVCLNYGNVSLFSALGSDDKSLQSAVTNENFWRIAFTTPLDIPSAPFTIDTSIIVLQAVQETVKDDTEKGYTADFYASDSWQNNVEDSDLRAGVTGSPKTQDQFFVTYLNRILSSNAQ
jgi:hypothetical protein